MLRSLVGSEMCIRDSPAVLLTGSFQAVLKAVSGGGVAGAAASVAGAANGNATPGAENAANPMTQAMIGFPALAGIVIVVLRILSSYALPEAALTSILPTPPSPWHLLQPR
eukprot:TRINITY_DN28514_c0_g1_i1.p1 TRINITY_DN28514_c0_g1~~TRINITY_DN28514_c0_g1_i1.p1  ORF type:complete len:111 (+),score=24.33 TRINITY_DN28514_c0_g1_i1:64-396(+)